MGLFPWNKLICWIHFRGRVFCNESTEGERSENPSAVYLQGEIQTDLTWHETDLAWNRCGMNRLDSPTAGNNINTQDNDMATYNYNEGHMTRTNQWETRRMTKTSNEHMSSVGGKALQVTRVT